GVKAQLVIGNHRLDGKVIKLDKPLLLIRKQDRSSSNNKVDNNSNIKDKPAQTSISSSSRSRYENDHSDEDDDDIDEDDTMTSTDFKRIAADTATASTGSS